MDIIQEFSKYFSKVIGIDSMYTYLIISTIITIIIFSIIKKIGKIIISKGDNRKKEFSFNRRFQNFLIFVEILVVICIWSDYIKSFMTLISLLSATIALALRDLILNFCCGIFIKMKKVFTIEDRIEIQGIKGDVVNIKALNFEVLEVNGDDISGQSTGVIINFPNSVVFTEPLKNYTKGFTYIWQEIDIPLSLDGDITEARHTVYKIVNNIDTIKNVPKRMANQIKNLIFSYRVYFNNYEPIVYTKMVGTHVELKLRYLVHPKNARVIESQIWEKILYEYKQGNICLTNSVQPVSIKENKTKKEEISEK